MTGTTPTAWNDPTKGAELAQSQMDRGADIVYHAAGGTGTGVIRAVADADMLAIGVDSDQYALAPGNMLTSMVKRVDVAAYDTLSDAMSGNFDAGVNILGLAEDGVDWVNDDNNEELLTADIRKAVQAAREAIIAGDIVVHNYEDDSSCPTTFEVRDMAAMSSGGITDAAIMKEVETLRDMVRQLEGMIK